MEGSMKMSNNKAKFAAFIVIIVLSVIVSVQGAQAAMTLGATAAIQENTDALTKMLITASQHDSLIHTTSLKLTTNNVEQNSLSAPASCLGWIAWQIFNCLPINGNIEGYVTSSCNSAAISGANVYTDIGYYSGVTDSSGYYNISVPPGKYTVTAFAPGYLSSSTYNISVTSGITKQANFVLDEAIPPTVTFAKPAVADEYVSGVTFIKAYINDNCAVSSANFYVDGVFKGLMQQESDYWRFNWNTSGTAVGEHTIKIVAVDGSSNTKSVERTVYAHPTVQLEQISFVNGHTLWQRQLPDEEITSPHWTSSLITHPAAYTIGSQMTVEAAMNSTGITGNVNIKYSVGGTWMNSNDVIQDTYNIDKEGSGSFPCSLSHQPSALSRVMDYHIYETYHFYVRKSPNSDWCPAGSKSVTHPQIYLTFGAPIGPWGTASDPRACWSYVIGLACGYMPEDGYSSAQTLDARDKLANAAYWWVNKTYDGGPNNSTDGAIFRMHQFLFEKDFADCRDMSSWWVKLCNSIGLSGQVRRIQGPFNTEQISPIGGGSWNDMLWGFHQVGWSNNVYDPCVRLKNTQNVPRLPVNEDITNPYQTDLHDTSTFWLRNEYGLPIYNEDGTLAIAVWSPQPPFSLQEAY